MKKINYIALYPLKRNAMKHFWSHKRPDSDGSRTCISGETRRRSVHSATHSTRFKAIKCSSSLTHVLLTIHR